MCYDNCLYRNSYTGDCIYGGRNVPADGNCQLIDCEVCTRTFASDYVMVEVDGKILCQECAKDFLEAMEEE